MSIVYASDKNYHELLQQEGITLVDFYTTTCVPCKMFSRLLEDMTEDYPFMNIVKVNITDYPTIGQEEEIEAVPTVMFVKDGTPKEKVVGLMDEDEVVEKIMQYYYA